MAPLESAPSHARALMDGSDLESHAVQLSLAKKERNSHFSAPLIFSLVLTSCLGIAGFIMAAWSTHQLKTAKQMTTSLTSAILVTSQSDIPPDYSLIINMFRGTGYWGAKQDMYTQRSDHGVAAYNNKQYVFGGYSWQPPINKTVLTSFLEFDPVYSIYTNLTDMPEPRARFAWSVANDKLYVFGGFTAPDDNATAVDTTLIYDFLQKTWSNSAAKMSQPKSDQCAGSYNGKVYMVGGYSADFLTAFREIEQYDPATDQWSIVPGPQLQLGRGDCQVVTTGNKLYVLGGTYYNSSAGDCVNQWWTCYLFTPTVEVFDPAANTVTQLASMRNERGDFGASESTPGRIIVAGGEYADSNIGVSRLLAQPWVEEYDIASNYWTPKASLPEARFRFSMARGAEQVMAFGGHPSCPTPDQGNSDTSANECYAHGLNQVLAFTDVQDTYPNVYLLTRNPTANTN